MKRISDKNLFTLFKNKAMIKMTKEFALNWFYLFYYTVRKGCDCERTYTKFQLFDESIIYSNVIKKSHE